jgi:hypothetical protein
MSDQPVTQDQPTFLLHVAHVVSDVVAIAGALEASGQFGPTTTIGQVIGLIVAIGGILVKAGVLHLKTQIGGGK